MKKQSNTPSNHALLKPVCQIIFFTLLLIFTFSCQHSAPPKPTGQQIVVTANVSKYFYRSLQKIYTVKNEMYVTYFPFPSASPDVIAQSVSGKVVDGKVIWILHSASPLKISPPFGSTIIMNPGDSVHINYLYDYPIYSGKNALPLELLTSLMKTEEKLIKPRIKNTYNVHSLEDFMEWNHYLDNKLALQVPILEYYKDKLPASEYEDYAVNVIGSIESNRVDVFQALRDSVSKGYPRLTLSNLQDIWDSTQYNPSARWLRSLSTYYGSISDIYAFNKMELFRQFGFDFSNDSLASSEIRTYLYYTKAKQRYKGLMRERLLTYILDEPTITELGLKSPTTQALLKDYYSQPGYPEYKAWVKGLEQKRQQRELEKEKKKRDKEKQEG